MSARSQRNAAIAAACDASGILANPDALDRLIIWRMGDPRYDFKANTKGDKPAMQRQWTIQLRADFTDADRNDAIDVMVNELAAHAFATLSLMSDKGVKPHVVAFSDDNFKGHTDLDWVNMGDPLGDAKRAAAPRATDPPFVKVPGMANAMPSVEAEQYVDTEDMMLAAVRQMA